MRLAQVYKKCVCLIVSISLVITSLPLRAYNKHYLAPPGSREIYHIIGLSKHEERTSVLATAGKSKSKKSKDDSQFVLNREFPLDADFVYMQYPEKTKNSVKATATHIDVLRDSMKIDKWSLGVLDFEERRCLIFKLGRVSITCLPCGFSNFYAFSISVGQNIIGHGIISYDPHLKEVKFRFKIHKTAHRNFRGKGYGKEALVLIMAMCLKGRLFGKKRMKYFVLSQPSPEKTPPGMGSLKRFLRKAGFDRNYRFSMEYKRKSPYRGSSANKRVGSRDRTTERSY